MRVLPDGTVALLLAVVFLRLPFAEMQVMPSGSSESTVSVQIDKDEAWLTAGDWVEFETTLQNTGTAPTPPLVAHLNIAAVQRGPYVDPEDWSSDRTRYLRPLSAGVSRDLTWKVHALLGGEFSAFVSIVSPEKDFAPAASPPLRLHVAPDNILPISDVIPVVALVPMFPLVLLLAGLILTIRSRQGNSISSEGYKAQRVDEGKNTVLDSFSGAN